MTATVSGRATLTLKSRSIAALLAATALGGFPAMAHAQDEAPATPAPDQASAPAAQMAPQKAEADTIRSITVVGAQRLEPDTIISYIRLRNGQPYTPEAADQALKDLAATGLFADYTIRNNQGNVVITVVENPVVNRIIFEGNDRLKQDKILPEIRLTSRQIFTRAKVRADVNRIVELYKRQGRFAATVEPKMVMLDQNRVDVIYEIDEGPKSKVRKINIIGNEVFSDGDLKGEMVTKEASLLRFLSGGTSYDPDRLAFDQQNLRKFYLTNGYVDFRVVSAVAELTPDRRDFIITYVVEEGERYKFGEVKVDSQIRDFDSKRMTSQLPMKTGEWYDAQDVEDTVERLTETAGAFGYAFVDVRPDFERNKEDGTMDVTFLINEAPRVYVERIDVNGNTLTQDKVIRREFRLAEGDAFNSFLIARTNARINSLGYFQEAFEVEQRQGSAPDRIILEANVEEKPTGELQLSAGFSSIENFIFQGSIRQKNFRGRGQTVGASASYSRYSKSAQLSFTEPYVFNRNISAGIDVYYRDLNSFNFFNNQRNTTYAQNQIGLEARVGIPITEYLSALARYTINFDDVTLDENQFFADLDGDGVSTCEPLLAGRYLCDALGERITSRISGSVIYDRLDNRIRPSRGHLVSFNAGFAGLGGDVSYLRLSMNAAKYFPLGSGFIFSLRGEGGAIRSLDDRDTRGLDNVRLTDRFFLGEPQIRGFDIRGVGPRVLRKPIVADEDGNPVIVEDRERITDDSLGGKAYYLGRAELEIPLGTGARELGLRPSIFADIGAVFALRDPILQSSPFPGGTLIPRRDSDGNPLFSQSYDTDNDGTVETVVTANPLAPDGTANLALGTTIPPFVEEYVGDTAAPRIAIGVGVNWNSPFGPFRIDFAHVLLKQEGDDTKAFTFNVGTQF
ncbi:outer membrane protein assembly factor BamA [Pseudoblastomonas halimionae]|uniref:Outer membrane protein assembly factor BamA n=1 Tax=Alteriqipengyuania halimionae TaxID=1926630 RepID=A0A6I4U073_9SPHN|nr:outer membrane protein assembly factor BamA [Alteriqipengyuania halimionae]MXP09166.1 outer membrane protein assembly factor BamA [Alteriqipengyuania halimionae]